LRFTEVTLDPNPLAPIRSHAGGTLWGSYRRDPSDPKDQDYLCSGTWAENTRGAVLTFVAAFPNLKRGVGAPTSRAWSGQLFLDKPAPAPPSIDATWFLASTQNPANSWLSFMVKEDRFTPYVSSDPLPPAVLREQAAPVSASAPSQSIASMLQNYSWKNALGSEMNVTHSTPLSATTGYFIGAYKSAVGNCTYPQALRGVWNNNDHGAVISWSVTYRSFGKEDPRPIPVASSTGWVGVLETSDPSNLVIKTSWVLTDSSLDEKDDWETTDTNQGIFTAKPKRSALSTA